MRSRGRVGRRLTRARDRVRGPPIYKAFLGEGRQPPLQCFSVVLRILHIPLEQRELVNSLIT